MFLLLSCILLSAFCICPGQAREKTSKAIGSEGQTSHSNKTVDSLHSSTAVNLLENSGKLMTTTENSSQHVTFESFSEFATADMLGCFQSQDTQHIHAVAGWISFLHNTPDNTTGNCSVQLVVPEGKVLHMYISVRISPCRGYKLFLSSDVTAPFFIDLYCEIDNVRSVSTDNRVRLDVKRLQLNASIELSLNFTAELPPKLEVISLTPTTGYIQSPHWDGRSFYPSNLDLQKRLKVPPNSTVMISVIAMDIEGLNNCSYDWLTISVGESSTTTTSSSSSSSSSKQSAELVQCNDIAVFKAVVFHTDVLIFHFHTDREVEHTGFRVFFSFHDYSETPELLEGGKWNCSIPYWSTFQQHLMCNFIVECWDKEDETDCNFTSSSCGEGLLSIASRCYIYVTWERLLTWNDAANECLRRDAYLASLNSPGEWNEVIEFVGSLAKEPVYVGLQLTGPSFPNAYREWFQWTDGSVVLYTKLYGSYDSYSADCSFLEPIVNNPEGNFLNRGECHKLKTSSFLCEKDSHQPTNLQKQRQRVTLPPQKWPDNSQRYVLCPAGHATQTFLACDFKTACRGGEGDGSSSACGLQRTPPPPSLLCRNRVDSVPYTLVCDHRPDCSDSSDESFCVFPSCRLSGKFQCANKQCLEPEKQCDKIHHCLDSSDERLCKWHRLHRILAPAPPAIIHFDRDGSYKIKSLSTLTNQTTSVCPETHFLCPGKLTYCMPVYVRCNGVYDCPGREDEDGCDRYQCPGFYRCRASSVCVHASHLCDGVFQCPQQDDELLCEATCPKNCSCQGLAFYCHGQFPAEQYPELRFLHAPGTGLTPHTLKLNFMLIYLNLAKCKLKELNDVEFPNLRILDLSYNDFTSLSSSQLAKINNLQKLSLAGNPLKFPITTDHDSLFSFPQLETLDLSNIVLPELNVTDLTLFPKLSDLNLTGCGTERVGAEGFQLLPFLRYLDTRGCPMTEFARGIFQGLKYLGKVWADNYKLCCPATLPESFSLPNCHSPSSEVSSCDALLRSDFYRVVLSVVAALALTGNLSSFMYRVVINPTSSHLGFGVFVTHLCMSDFLMGVYLAVIGIADRIYYGSYLWKDNEWKQSATCQLAGFLALLSSEVSAFIICLITVDRFIVLRFPFSSIYFKKKSAHVACCIAWFIGIVLAGIPLMPGTEHWRFYQQNGICIPLPVTRRDYPGHDYAFGVIIIVNFVLFVLIAVGQVFIYWSILANTMSAQDSNKKRSKDITIARRLLTIAMSDFVCWFPIGVLGLLASSGFPMPGEVSVVMAIVFLPINAAINPFLYTLNNLLEKRRKARMQKLQKMLMSSLASKSAAPDTRVVRVGEDHSYTETEAVGLISGWLSGGLFSRSSLDKIAFDVQDRQTVLERENEV